MSNAIFFDPLLVHYLASELHGRLQGRACAAVPIFAADRSAVLPLDGGEALVLDLHPLRGWVRILPWDSDVEELDAVCLGVSSPPDERRMVVRIQAADRFRALERRLEVELHTNQWNALLVDHEDERILSLLWSRAAGGRSLRTGLPYRPPAPASRLGAAPELDREQAWERWLETLEPAAPEERPKRLISAFAYTGTVNAAPILGDAARSESDSGSLRAAFERWCALRALPPASPVLLSHRSRLIPYPLPLPALEQRPVASLLAGMMEVADRASTSVEEVAAPGAAFIRRRLAAMERRLRRLEQELTRTGEADRIRLRADLLLARKRLVPRGADSVKLRDWTGGLVEVALDPALSVTENAARWYDEARKRQRAEERIPDLLQAAREEHQRWAAALQAVERGEAPAWLAAEAQKEGATGERMEGEEEEARPYRRYRTSGGLEVRVGRSARANDRLTFAHSSPNDVWLHARSVPGSHVLLRWREPEGAPPARDLEEAAVLAALHSKARSSALVPVDWTRRKYVRKPRGAPPGAVIPQRVRTLFVEPDEEVEARMRDE